MKRTVLASALLLGLACPASALPSAPPVVALAIGPRGQAKPLMEEFASELRHSRRFEVTSAIAPIALDQPLSPTLKKLKHLTKADWVFVGTYASAPDHGVELTGRVYNLTLLDTSKDLHFQASREDVLGLARQLTTYMRSLNPLQGEITGLRDSRVLLDVGSEDGVATGSVFSVTHGNAEETTSVGLVKVVATDPWFSTAEVVSHQKGVSIVPGDRVHENVGYAFIR